MLDLTVIILTFNEERHIERAIKSVQPIAREIIVVDSFSTDKTCEIAESLGARVFSHPWPGNQASQFNWALDNLEITSEWIFRLDADEYILPELSDELQSKLAQVSKDVNGIELKRRNIFMGRWLKRGIYPVILLRIFRNGLGRSEERLMDEHIVLSGGDSITLDNDFVDENLNNLSWFCKKHVDYSVREAAEMVDLQYGISERSDEVDLTNQAAIKRKRKLKYAQKPLFWRSFAYFIYRYFLKGAFREGKEGFIFTFIQGWWYRTLVDAKIYEIRKNCGDDKDKIKAYLSKEYNIKI